MILGAGKHTAIVAKRRVDGCELRVSFVGDDNKTVEAGIQGDREMRMQGDDVGVLETLGGNRFLFRR